MAEFSETKIIKLYKSTKEALDEVSSTFCTAKWLQSTIHLATGTTHSCHHPAVHKIPTGGLDTHPALLHNTPIKMAARQDLLDGKQTPECGYCWNVENLNQGHFSDRIAKSASSWATPYTDLVRESGVGSHINPTYVEISFESTCNFSCTYCSPEISTQIMAEAKKHGPYKLQTMSFQDISHLQHNGRMPIDRKEYNPYTEAFWKWWPDLYTTLDTFRITGGEPLLSEHTWRVLDYIIENPNPELNLGINTNMGIPSKLVDKLIQKLNFIVENGLVKKVTVFTSVEATGKQAEYIRFGMDHDLFMKNITTFLDWANPDIDLSFMITTNILSVTTFPQYLESMIALRAKYHVDRNRVRIPLNICYLRYPAFLSLVNLTDDVKHKFANDVRAVVDKYRDAKTATDVEIFYPHEINEIERTLEVMLQTEADPRIQGDFAIYHREYDKRRGTSFGNTFPELNEFMAHCERQIV